MLEGGSDDAGGHRDAQSLIGDEARDDVLGYGAGTSRESRAAQDLRLATTRPDGRPHLMPVIGIWIDGAMHVVAGRGRKGTQHRRGRSVCHRHEQHDAPVPRHRRRGPCRSDHRRRRRSTHRRLPERNSWPWRPRATRSTVRTAPGRPTAYTIFRIVPSRVFGLPGMTGMEQYDPADLPRPTRWDFSASLTRSRRGTAGARCLASRHVPGRACISPALQPLGAGGDQAGERRTEMAVEAGPFDAAAAGVDAADAADEPRRMSAGADTER